MNYIINEDINIKLKMNLIHEYINIKLNIKTARGLCENDVIIYMDTLCKES